MTTLTKQEHELVESLRNASDVFVPFTGEDIHSLIAIIDRLTELAPTPQPAAPAIDDVPGICGVRDCLHAAYMDTRAKARAKALDALSAQPAAQPAPVKLSKAQRKALEWMREVETAPQHWAQRGDGRIYLAFEAANGSTRKALIRLGLIEATKFIKQFRLTDLGRAALGCK